MEFIYLYNLLMPTKLFLMNSVQVVDSQRIIGLKGKGLKRPEGIGKIAHDKFMQLNWSESIEEKLFNLLSVKHASAVAASKGEALTPIRLLISS